MHKVPGLLLQSMNALGICYRACPNFQLRLKRGAEKLLPVSES